MYIDELTFLLVIYQNTFYQTEKQKQNHVIC